MSYENNKCSSVPFVSVIVPVYNTEKYLKQCLNSLRNQTLENIEIIAIDDGSTDKSGKICDIFAEKDYRIKVVHKKNQGLSAARNDGIQLALADYIMFVDSDDWVEQKYCEIPYYTAKKFGADLIVFQFIQHDKKNILKNNTPFPKEGIRPKKEVLTCLWQFTTDYAWNKLYKRDLFKTIRYPVGRLYEDIAVTYRLFYNAEKIILINNYLYNYRNYRPNSITNTYSQKLFSEYVYFSFKKIDNLKKWGYDCYNQELRISWLYLISAGQNNKWSERCKKYLKDVKYFPRGMLNWKHRFLFQVYKISPKLFDFIIVMAGKRNSFSAASERVLVTGITGREK